MTNGQIKLAVPSLTDDFVLLVRDCLLGVTTEETLAEQLSMTTEQVSEILASAKRKIR